MDGSEYSRFVSLCARNHKKSGIPCLAINLYHTFQLPPPILKRHPVRQGPSDDGIPEFAMLGNIVWEDKEILGLLQQVHLGDEAIVEGQADVGQAISKQSRIP